MFLEVLDMAFCCASERKCLRARALQHVGMCVLVSQANFIATIFIIKKRRLGRMRVCVCDVYQDFMISSRNVLIR